MKLKLLKYKLKGVIKRKLIDLVKEYQLNQNNECYIEIISIFGNLINKYVNKAEIEDRDDLKQEMLMKIHIVLLKFKIHDYEKDESEFKKYLEVTIRNVFIDYKRKLKKKEALFSDENIIVDIVDKK